MILNAPEASNCCEGIGITNSSAVCDYAASCANSFRGSGQYWYNILQYKTPADSLPKSSAPLVLGSTGFQVGGDPTFVGRAGHKGSYFNLNLTYLTYTGQQGSTASSPAGGFAANWHKSGTSKQPATLVFSLTYKNTSTIQSLFSTKVIGTGQGITGFINAAGRVGLTQQGDTSSSTILSAASLTDGVSYIIGVGWNGASIQGIWVGSSTGEVGATAFKTATGACTSPLIFGLQYDATFTTPAFAHGGTKLYDILIFNKLLSNTDMAGIIPVLEARNGIDFTP